MFIRIALAERGIDLLYFARLTLVLGLKTVAYDTGLLVFPCNIDYCLPQGDFRNYKVVYSKNIIML